MLGWLPGASADAMARREVADLNETRTGSADREGAWNWQDDIGAFLAGSNRESIIALAKTKADSQLEESLSGRIADVEANLGTLSGKYSGVDGKTKKAVQSDLSQDEARIKALVQARTTKGFNVADLDPNASAVDILAATSKQVNDNDDAVTLKADTRYDNERDYRRSVEREGRLDRNLERQMNAENNKMQLQLEYARLAQSDRQRTADRKDKAIMALLSGLGNLSAGFTV
tara:strand:+ start:8328 stop:9020 length:693 start_codon:yes stop_codon:yes gene_type:complete